MWVNVNASTRSALNSKAVFFFFFFCPPFVAKNAAVWSADGRKDVSVVVVGRSRQRRFTVASSISSSRLNCCGFLLSGCCRLILLLFSFFLVFSDVDAAVTSHGFSWSCFFSFGGRWLTKNYDKQRGLVTFTLFSTTLNPQPSSLIIYRLSTVLYSTLSTYSPSGWVRFLQS